MVEIEKIDFRQVGKVHQRMMRAKKKKKKSYSPPDGQFNSQSFPSSIPVQLRPTTPPL